MYPALSAFKAKQTEYMEGASGDLDGDQFELINESEFSAAAICVVNTTDQPVYVALGDSGQENIIPIGFGNGGKQETAFYDIPKGSRITVSTITGAAATSGVLSVSLMG